MWPQESPLTEYNARKPIRTVEKLFDKIGEYARAEDSARRDVDSMNPVTEVKGTAQVIEKSQPQKYKKGQKGCHVYNVESGVEDGFVGGGRGRGGGEAKCEIHDVGMRRMTAIP